MLCHSNLFKDLFILFETQSYRDAEAEGEKEVFHLLVHSPDGCNGQSCANLKPGTRSFFQVSHVGAGAQGLGSSSAAFTGHSRELDRKWSSWDSNLCPYGMPAQQARALTHCATALALQLSFFFFLKIYFIYLKDRVTVRGRDREKDLPSAGSLPRWPQQPEIRQSKARRQELLLGLPHGCRGPSAWASSTAFPDHSRELDQKGSC